MLKISVISVVYNGEKFIKEAIETVLRQTYKNIEFIIMGSIKQLNLTSKVTVEDYFFVGF